MNRYLLYTPRPTIPEELMGFHPGDLLDIKIPVPSRDIIYPTPTPAKVLKKIRRVSDGKIFLQVQWANGTKSGWPQEWFSRWMS